MYSTFDDLNSKLLIFEYLCIQLDSHPLLGFESFDLESKVVTVGAPPVVVSPDVQVSLD